MSLNVKKCKRCKKIFNYLGKDFCAECIILFDDSFVRIREYLEENPNNNVNEICKDLDIDQDIVLYLIKEGRVTTTDKSVKCSICGTKIGSGSLCSNCSEKINSKFESISQKQSIDNKNKSDDNTAKKSRVAMHASRNSK